MPFSLIEFLDLCRQRVERYLLNRLPGPETFPQPLFEAMHYSLFAGGKRVRPAFAYAACEAVGGQSDPLTPFAAALEMIHTYSLVHDDLPAMDDDDLRRGKPTNHKVYGDGMAILVGDALLTDAFALMSQPQETDRVAADCMLKIVGEIATAAGSRGMVAGQALDLVAEGMEIDLPTLEFLHTHKTGALIRAAVRIGGLVGGADDTQLEPLTRYAERVGLAFQIADDVLDIESDTATLGKPVGSDEELHKATYPALVGIPEAKRCAAELLQSALDALRPLGDKAEALRALAHFVVERKY